MKRQLLLSSLPALILAAVAAVPADEPPVTQAVKEALGLAAPVPEFLQERGYEDGQDFHAERTLLPGVTHTFDAYSTGPLTINLVTVDLANRNLAIESEKGGPSLRGRETVDKIAARLTEPGEKPVVVVNADFWSRESIPINLLVDEGMIWKGPWVGPAGQRRAVFSFDDQSRMDIGLPDWSVVLKDADSDAELAIDAINIADEIVATMAFTPPFGTEAPAPEGSETQIELELEDAEWTPNDAARARVRGIGGLGGVTLTENTVVLHLTEGAPDWIEIGEVLTLEAKLGNLPGKVVGVLGGGPTLVQDGESIADVSSDEEKFPATFDTTRHPRSALGLKADGRTLVIATVDGRQEGRSIGIGLGDLADFMKAQGCHDAMNLDGGGSTSLWVCNEIVNFPSDPTGPRSVTNALVVNYLGGESPDCE